MTYLLLGQVVGEVCNHDLSLGRDAVGRGPALTALTARLVLRSLGRIVSSVLVSNLVQMTNLSGSCGGSRVAGGTLNSLDGRLILLLLILVQSQPIIPYTRCFYGGKTYTAARAAATGATSPTATGTSTAAGRLAAACSFASTLTIGTLDLLGSGLGLAS